MDQFTGKKLDGRYEIREKVGSGGMSVVYKGYDLLDEKPVAIKILKEEYAGNEEFLRRFKNESKAIAVFNHPNIVRVYDVCFGKVQAIVMEYIDGITLKEFLERKGALSWNEALYFAVQILRALQHAHGKGVVHRDIKPQNIMLLPDGTIKVMDFGIARFARGEVRTLGDKAIGSVHYISPEQAKGEGGEDRSDIYSVGVMLFEMLTGQLPFEADSPISVAIKQISSKPQSPREINPDIPEGLESITLRAMEKDPTRRYQSAAEMIADIEEFKKNPSIQFVRKYIYDDDKTQYVKAIKQIREEEKEEEAKQKKPLPIIPILAGVTAACVIVAIVFLVFFISRVFGGKADITLEDFRGKTIAEVNALPGCEQLRFEVVGEEYSEQYGAGEIIEHTPEAGRTVKVDGAIQAKISKGTKSIKVPDIHDYSREKASQMLTSLGLKFTFEEMFDDEVDKDVVIKTDPAMGQEISLADTITVYVSKGKANVKVGVPDLSGLSQSQADQLLKAKKLKLGAVTQQDSNKPAGTIIAQSPGKDTQVGEGTAVDIIVSSGQFDRTQTIMVPLPQAVTTSVEMTAYLDGIMVAHTTLLPHIVKVWQFDLTDRGQKSLTVYYNGQVYQQFAVDFDRSTVSLTVDNSASFVPPPASSAASAPPTSTP